MAGHQHGEQQRQQQQQQQQKKQPPPHVTVAPRAGHAQHACPACGRPVDTVVRRHKSLGIFVPEWGPGPCRNPDCPAYVPQEGRD